MSSLITIYIACIQIALVCSINNSRENMFFCCFFLTKIYWYFSYFSIKLLMCHNICLRAEIRKILTLILLFTTTPTFANSVDPDQKPSDQELHCLSYSLWIWMKTLYDVIWLADSQKWVWLIKLFSRRRVKYLPDTPLIKSSVWNSDFRINKEIFVSTIFVFMEE